MKLLFSCMLLGSAALRAASGNPSLAGTWQVHNSIAGNESDQTCTFTAKGSELGGRCSSDNGPLEIHGKIVGKKITWTYKSEYNGSPLTVNYDGVMGAGGKIAGTVSVPEYSVDGEFTATPAK